ncbi:hypothetical protein BC829DRAFT_414126 [Chytridium lagenaria]|nr:hypothetical protein BC829DRAFT_414126 [Chytridium lagenaria]
MPNTRTEGNVHAAALAAALAELDMLRRSKPVAVSAMIAETKRRDIELRPSNPHVRNQNDMAFDLGSLLFPRTTRVQLPVPEAALESSTNISSRVLSSKSSPLLRAERIAMISACINSGDLDRAEVLFHRTAKSSTHEEMKEVVSTGMVNAFIEGFLDLERTPKLARKSPMDRAIDWKLRLGEYDLKPDSTTFAILIRYALKENDVNRAAKFVTEMDEFGLEPHILLKNSRFVEPEDRAPLESVLRTLGKSTTVSIDVQEEVAHELLASPAARKDISTTNDELMLSAMQESSGADTAESKGESPKLHPLVKEELVKTDSIGVNILRDMLATLNLTGYASKLEKQKMLEEKSILAATEEHAAQFERLPKELQSIMQISNQLVATWHMNLVPIIRRELESIEKATRDADQHQALPFLKLITPEQISKITITCFLRFLKNHKNEFHNSGEVVTSQLLAQIGNGVEQEFAMQQLKKKKNHKIVQSALRMHNLHLNGALFDSSVRKIMAIVAQKQAKELEQENWFPKWPESVVIQAGSILAALLMKTAKIYAPYTDPENPARDMVKEEFAFKHDYISDGGFKRIGVIKTHPHLMEQISANPMAAAPRLLPMVVKPRPWITRNSGGYLSHKVDVARSVSNPEHMAYISAADERQHLGHVYHSLDVLGSTAWIVNERVYNVVRQIWNSGEGLADIPPASMPSAEPKPRNWDDLDTAAKRAYYSNGKPLGKDGLRWLKIQISNLAGNDKVSFDDRVKFADAHMSDGRRWWLKSDDPFQLLATCYELTDAIRSPKPEEFLSRIPVHQDGTCNGLQHYAALGGDIPGALQVNLLPTAKPSDIYTAVADRVARRIEEDAEKGCAISLKMKGARALQKWLNVTARMIAKSAPVSTIPKADLDDAAFLAKIGSMSNNPDGLLGAALLDSSVDDVTADTVAVADAKPELTVKVKGRKPKKVEKMSTVIWTTPLGMPIVQPYRDYKLKQPVNVQISNLLLSTTHIGPTPATSPPMSSILRDAFVKLHSQNIMVKLRDEFKERYGSHKHPVEFEITSLEHLLKWKEHLVATGRTSAAATIGLKTVKRKVSSWVDLEIPELPERGELDLEKVKESPYFFH